MGSNTAAECTCTRMPKAIYVKLDDCNHQFLPPAACSLHRLSGHDPQCKGCASAVQPGVFAVRPIARTWKYWLPDNSGKYVLVVRKQLPLMPVQSVNLYSMQGTTADPGMVAYWMFPGRCSSEIQWLIVYVMLSRPRSLSQLKSVNLSSKIRQLIEKGPPDDLVQNFNSLFSEKIQATHALAADCAKRYGLLEGCI